MRSGDYLTVCSVALLVLLLVVGQTRAVAVRAQSSELFADSVCINTHMDYTSTSYGTNPSRIIEMLAEAGIYNVRESSSNVAAQFGAKGLKMNFGWAEPNWNTNNNISFIDDFVSTLKDLISKGMLVDALLNVNEPDGMWQPKGITYNGKGFPGGVLDYMRDFHARIRADPELNDKWIIGSPMGVTSTLPANCCSEWIDYADFHPYPFDGNYLAETWEVYDTIYRYFYFSNQPSVNVAQPWPSQLDRAQVYYTDLPFFATETGYSTETTQLGTSLRAQGLYINRLFAEYFRLGIRRTCWYEFLDQHDDPADHESNFGIVHFNYTAKPSYTALKNFMAVVRSDWKPTAQQLRPADYDLVTLDFALNVSAVGAYDRTEYVHHLLLQKPDQTLLLLLWHEISDEATNGTNRQIYPPRMPTVVTLPSGFVVNVFAPNDGPDVTGEYSADGRSTFTDETSISLNVPDHVIILQLTASPTSKSDASPFSSGFLIELLRCALAYWM